MFVCWSGARYWFWRTCLQPGIDLKNFFFFFFWSFCLFFFSHPLQIPSQIILLPPFQQAVLSLQQSPASILFASVLMFLRTLHLLLKMYTFFFFFLSIYGHAHNEGDGWVIKGDIKNEVIGATVGF